MAFTIDYGGEDGHAVLLAALRECAPNDRNAGEWFVEIKRHADLEVHGYAEEIITEDGRDYLAPAETEHDEPEHRTGRILHIEVDTISDLIIP